MHDARFYAPLYAPSSQDSSPVYHHCPTFPVYRLVDVDVEDVIPFKAIVAQANLVWQNIREQKTQASIPTRQILPFGAL